MNEQEQTTTEQPAEPEGSGHVVRNVLIGIGGVLVAIAAAVLVIALVNGGIGERTYTPATADEIPADGYEVGIGELTVDLRDLDWKRGETVDLDAQVGIGRLEVLVPADVDLAVDAHVQAGEAVVDGEREDGWNTELQTDPEPGRSARLELDADVELGQLRVIR